MTKVIVPSQIPFNAPDQGIPADMEKAKLELLNLLEARGHKIETRQIDLYFTDSGPNGRDNYRKHVAFFTAGRDYRERVVLGGNRCISPWTLIDTVDGPAPAHALADGSSVDVVSWDGEKQCIAPMSGWFLKGLEPMFRVVLDSGQFFDCTGEHRLLDAEGNYRSFQDVMLLSSGLRCRHTAADFLASCASDGYQYGQQLRQVVGSDLKQFPSPIYAQKHSPRIFDCEDVEEHKRLCNQALQAYGPHSSLGDLRPLAGLFSLFEDVSLHNVSRSLKYVHQKVHRLLAESSQHLQSGAEVLRQRTSSWRSSKPYYPLVHPELFGGNKIIAVVPIGLQPILDATVSSTSCYSSAGVIHHNTGKSLLGAYELALHLTGEYPNWWKGRRFSRPVQALAAGKEAKITRDTVQQKLLGKQGEFGTGMIPGENLEIEKCSSSRAASGLYDGVPVKHKSGGWSMLRFRSYDQGRTAFEGVERDFVWSDEECPQDIHGENLMRTMTTGGITINTFTPLKGETPLVQDLLKRANEGTVYATNIWWDDAGHITPAMIEDMKKRYPTHELRARRFGEPQLGTGAIFTADPDSYTIRATQIPAYWPRIYGLDFGWVHPTAALWAALDRESDTLYVYSEHRQSKAPPAVHVGAIKARGEWITGVSETVGTNQQDGTKMINIYKAHGLKLKRAVKGPGSIESGIMLIQERMSEGRLKILETCPMILEELRRYHRDKNNKVVAKVDDLIDCLRYLLTGLKYAKTEVESRGTVSNDNIREVNFYGARRIV